MARRDFRLHPLDHFGLSVPADGRGTLEVISVNRFSKLINSDPDAFTEFLEFLESTNIQVGGITIRPSNLISLRKQLQLRGIDVT